MTVRDFYVVSVPVDKPKTDVPLLDCCRNTISSLSLMQALEKGMFRLPLFVVTGGGGSGKSTVAGGLRGRLDTCLVVEADLFYPIQESARSNDDYWSYLIFLCRELMQNGKPVVLFGWVNPRQCEASEHIGCFSSVHYLALVSDKRTQEARIRGRYPTSREEPPTDEFIAMALQANQILKDEAGKGSGVTVLDTTGMSVDDTLVETASWISARL